MTATCKDNGLLGMFFRAMWKSAYCSSEITALCIPPNTLDTMHPQQPLCKPYLEGCSDSEGNQYKLTS